MKFQLPIRLAVCTSLIVAVSTVAHGQIIDSFSTDSSSNYNDFYGYNPNSNPAGNYAITGGTFTPTTPSNSTEYFIRNTGQVLGAAGGDSVSIDYLGGTANDAGGLVFSTSATSATNALEALIFDGFTNNESPYALFNYQVNGATSVPLNGNPNDSWTLTFTRETGANSGILAYSLTDPAGNNFTTPLTGTLTLPSATSIYYFGVGVFGGDNTPPSGVTLDNLAFTPAASVPEPSSFGMMVLGGGILAMFLRYKKLSV